MTEHKVHCSSCGRLLSSIRINTAENSHISKLDIMAVCDSPGGCGKPSTLLLDTQDFKVQILPEISNCPTCGGTVRDNHCAACEATGTTSTIIQSAPNLTSNTISAEWGT